tara:strand:- start:1083 stop:1259 length:177 start_codon:yes stop_codon:yes gene_type:complete
LGYLSPEGFIANQNTHTPNGPIFRSRSTALETLSGLQQDGKLIGIISHVSGMKEIISA